MECQKGLCLTEGPNSLQSSSRSCTKPWSVTVRYVLHKQPHRIIEQSLSLGISLSIFVFIHPCWIILLTSNTFLLSLHAIHLSTLGFLSLSHQPLLLRWQKTESATPMAMATTMPRIHHLSISCWSCRLSF
jgi:hypothetical protein